MNEALWIATASDLLTKHWCITPADAGLTEAELVRAWRDGETPLEFVTWFAENYDLIRYEPNPFRPEKF